MFAVCNVESVHVDNACWFIFTPFPAPSILFLYLLISLLFERGLSPYFLSPAFYFVYDLCFGSVMHKRPCNIRLQCLNYFTWRDGLLNDVWIRRMEVECPFHWTGLLQSVEGINRIKGSKESSFHLSVCLWVGTLFFCLWPCSWAAMCQDASSSRLLTADLGTQSPSPCEPILMSQNIYLACWFPFSREPWSKSLWPPLCLGIHYQFVRAYFLTWDIRQLRINWYFITYKRY